ncbi:MAG: type II toxin-antitoxin system ParD family antitoxin [Acetobacteraceae bacterium]|nr:type II toxin-antitoxin system ParD family antitoxin [Acetobacteraceae bacterium]
MSTEKLSITLPADMVGDIRAAVSKGGYSSTSEVIREAMQLWQERRGGREQRLHAVRTKIQEAVDDPRRFTDEEIRRHFAARFDEAEKQRNP